MAKTNYLNKVEDAIAIDLETGGLNPNSNGIRSVGLYVSDDDYLYFLVKPEINLRYDAISEQVTGITEDQMEKEGVSESQAIEMIKEYLNAHKPSPDEKPFICGQNLQFDLSFLEALFARNSRFVSFGELINHHYLDSMHYKMFLSMINAYKGPIKLEESYEVITGKTHTAHNALEDAKACKEEIIAIRDLAKKQKWNSVINL